MTRIAESCKSVSRNSTSNRSASISADSTSRSGPLVVNLRVTLVLPTSADSYVSVCDPRVNTSYRSHHSSCVPQASAGAFRFLNAFGCRIQLSGTWTPKQRDNIDRQQAGCFICPHPASVQRRSHRGCVRPPSADQPDTASGITGSGRSPRENPATSNIVRHNSHVRKSGSDLALDGKRALNPLRHCDLLLNDSSLSTHRYSPASYLAITATEAPEIGVQTRVDRDNLGSTLPSSLVSINSVTIHTSAPAIKFAASSRRGEVMLATREVLSFWSKCSGSKRYVAVTGCGFAVGRMARGGGEGSEKPRDIALRSAVRLVDRVFAGSRIEAHYRLQDCVPVQCFTCRGDESVDAYVSVAPSAPNAFRPQAEAPVDLPSRWHGVWNNYGHQKLYNTWQHFVRGQSVCLCRDEAIKITSRGATAAAKRKKLTSSASISVSLETSAEATKSRALGVQCNSLDSHSARPGIDSRPSHPDFGFPWFSEITPGECWDGSQTKAMADSFPILAQSIFLCNLHLNGGDEAAYLANTSCTRQQNGFTSQQKGNLFQHTTSIQSRRTGFDSRRSAPPPLPDLRAWESCRTMPLVGGFSRGSSVSPALAFRCCSIPCFTLIGSQELDAKEPHNFTPSTLWLLGYISRSNFNLKLLEVERTCLGKEGGGGWVDVGGSRVQRREWTPSVCRPPLSRLSDERRSPVAGAILCVALSSSRPGMLL
ncbi:hypothetical protein PR048_007939 [Dryococelus australis]|uniref:Uncharacterized protein n=1 Tax=Dryococelus australis TaxID=614101 RepID=A0ABQ9HVN8_9NEOP|nr:hypothetical protein PR048_007939 [Dryococelus australis]